jgi:hypothetical protein
MFKKKTLTREEYLRLAALYRKRRTALDNKECIEKTLQPILKDLEYIRLEIDSIRFD